MTSSPELKLASTIEQPPSSARDLDQGGEGSATCAGQSLWLAMTTVVPFTSQPTTGALKQRRHGGVRGRAEVGGGSQAGWNRDRDLESRRTTSDDTLYAFLRHLLPIVVPADGLPADAHRRDVQG